jgi:hypothetical protein
MVCALVLKISEPDGVCFGFDKLFRFWLLIFYGVCTVDIYIL